MYGWLANFSQNLYPTHNLLIPDNLVPKILMIIIFTCILVVTREILGVFVKSIRGVTKSARILDLSDKKKYYPVAIGIIVGYLVMSQNPVWALTGGFLGGFLGLISQRGIQLFYRKITKEKRIGEVLILYEVLNIYAEAGYSLYEALMTGVYVVNFIEMPLRRCLNRWGQGPERALKKMAEEIDLPEADALVRILQRALVIGPGKLANYLSQEGKTMEKIREYRMERGLGVRPIIQTVYLLLPGFALFGVTLLPLGYSIAHKIMTINLN